MGANRYELAKRALRRQEREDFNKSASSLADLLATEVRDLLKSQKLTQKAAAKAAGISIASVRSCIGLGRSSPKLETFCKLLTATRATVSFTTETDL